MGYRENNRVMQGFSKLIDVMKEYEITFTVDRTSGTVSIDVDDAIDLPVCLTHEYREVDYNDIDAAYLRYRDLLWGVECC